MKKHWLRREGHKDVPRSINDYALHPKVVNVDVVLDALYELTKTELLHL